jgi:pathogenesis-related protein 1
VFAHDPNRNGCGQNINTAFIKKTTWPASVQAWQSEVAKFTYGAPDKALNGTGHYTQVVWATSNTVGCGFAECKDSTGAFFKYVCNYCPP